MKIEKFSSYFKGLLFRIFIAILCLASAGPTINTATAAPTVRSLVDRPDDVNGYQVHLVYVALNGSVDSNWDTNGKIDSWVTEANSWLMKQVGHKFIFDTYQGTVDVSFMQSKYKAAELCADSCEGLEKLVAEYSSQDVSYNGSKSLVFVINDKLPGESCGWAPQPSNQALIHDMGSERCGGYSSDLTRWGATYPVVSLLHELIHTYGISHRCSDNSDLMIGSPECSGSRGETMITLDNTRSWYVGSDASDGIDLLKMPIWSDGSGMKSYADIKQISDTKYISKLTDGTVFAVVGEKSKKFDWAWDKNFNPSGNGLICRFISGLVSITGTQDKSACVFDVPSSLRAGKQFTVTQSWVEGPWHGQASVTGVLVRKDFSSNPCTENTCFVGGTTTAKYSCWTSDVKNLILQQLINGKWADYKSVPTMTGANCQNNGQYVNYPDLTLTFQQSGTLIYRWVSPAHSGYSKYVAEPFAVVVNDENSAEPSQDEVTSAQTQAYELGKAADVAKVIASFKTTITCTKGKITKKISATNPKCPAGYKKK